MRDKTVGVKLPAIFRLVTTLQQFKMPGPDYKSPGAPLNHDRLNGWKEISNYLGKSVRTAQRWERMLAMPIHRIHTSRGEIVFGWKQELDRWQSSKEQESAAAPPPLPDEVTLEWLATLPEPELQRLARSGRVPRAVWSELVCQACLTLHRNGMGASTGSCQGILELLSSLPKSRLSSVSRQARSALVRWRQSEKK